MIELTQQAIDFIAPQHDRISCNDQDLSNAWGGWNGTYRENGSKDIQNPRCIRCYLLNHIGEDTDTLEFEIEPCLLWKEQ